MYIHEMFAKPIDRDIKGVIKVGQADEENVRQELEEYVVTREMQKHFADFFVNYKKGITGYTDKMGVWISGFFGSGKSHFLKIISYLLENKIVDGKRALDYFSDDQKIKDPMVLADMQIAANVPTDVILFNIDSKSDASGKQSKDAIVSVFLKAFNEKLGYFGTIPVLADLERELTAAKRYDEFKNIFKNNYGNSWETSRHKFDFIQDYVVETLVEMNFMSEAAARNLCEKANEPYSISIEDFARLVQDYIENKADNHHVVFLIDEMGQFIGDDSKLMLNLQTVTEDLGTACRGKAWVIVTSQQDIDAITKDMGLRSNDFSKIQGRFDTRLSLSSANVDEVIKKRILEKNQTAEKTLRLLYEQKSTIVKNLIVFNDGVEKKLYENGNDFSKVYPFVPYQFNLLGDVLTSIRKHSASGKHLSDGERSMLALFKESAVTLKDEEVGKLIPFNVFYDALHQFLDHSHRGVIIKASNNRYINPNQEEENFNVNVLKTLFMIKYVKEITANVDNIVSLMVDDIDTDRIELKKKVENALNVLVKQTLVQKNGEIYVFLTDEEQEINREIEHQLVEMSDVIRKVSELIFDDIYPENKCRYPAFGGRYNFAFNQIVDDQPYKSNRNYDISLRILTPNSDYSGDETTLRMMSGEQTEVLLVLPDDSTFMEEIRVALKIEKYLRISNESGLTKYEQIKDAKKIEARERNDNAKIFLKDAMKEATIYVNGDKLETNTIDIKSRINDALQRLVNTVYHKLNYIDTPMDESSIRRLLNRSDNLSFSLDNVQAANINALNDVRDYISTNSNIHLKTSMKTLMDRFTKAPYGFVEDDVRWLIADLFMDNDISLMVDGSNITLLNKTPNEIIRYITKREFIEKLLIDRREKASDIQKKSVREVGKELFGISTLGNDDDEIMQTFQRYSKGLFNELKQKENLQKNASLPGKDIVATGISLLDKINEIQSPDEFFNTIHHDRDDYLDFAEDYEPVKSFFAGEQKNIFEDALALMKIYDDSKNYITNEEIENLATNIKSILQMYRPYADIHRLPDLLNKFRNGYNSELDIREAPVRKAIDDARMRIMDAIKDKPYEEKIKTRSHRLFQEVYEKLKSCHNVAILQGIGVEVDALKIRLLNEIDKMDQELARAQAKKLKLANNSNDYSTQNIPVPKVKQRKNISIQTINISNSWQIETAQDLDKYLAGLRNEIINELDENTIINIEF